MPSTDITYCTRECGNMECKRNVTKLWEEIPIKGVIPFVSMTSFDDCKEWRRKMKLIDVLVMISKEELKEGTKVIVIEGKEEYTYRICPTDEENHELVNEDGENLFNNYYVDIISSEVELIEPTDNTTEKIEEIDVRAGNREGTGFVFDLPEMIIADKLNEVIRYINKEG